MQIYLPTGMLIFVSHMMNRFVDQYFDMVIQIHLTAMLVLATLWVHPPVLPPCLLLSLVMARSCTDTILIFHFCNDDLFKSIFLFSFIGISQELPSTAYIKMIDVWMLFTMICPFFEILMLWLKDQIKRDIGSTQGKHVKKKKKVSSCRDAGLDKLRDRLATQFFSVSSGHGAKRTFFVT